MGCHQGGKTNASGSKPCYSRKKPGGQFHAWPGQTKNGWEAGTTGGKRRIFSGESGGGYRKGGVGRRRVFPPPQKKRSQAPPNKLCGGGPSEKGNRQKKTGQGLHRRWARAKKTKWSHRLGDIPQPRGQGPPRPYPLMKGGVSRGRHGRKNIGKARPGPRFCQGDEGNRNARKGRDNQNTNRPNEGNWGGGEKLRDF